MGSVDTKSYFQVLQQFKHDVSHQKITQYESSRTGMRVIVIDQEGPKLYGYFVLATEIHDDSGAPHTLEHLVFLGSRSYKYKGFLDKLANRMYSNTNAWTAVDHTAYTLDTAGWASFRLLLPIYLEHVILPTITDAGCTTEVWHIDGTGNDAGVVYSEIQGIQNQAAELADLRAKRLMYPEGVGFRYETGGMMESLRVLTPDRIREFHREMYQPKNLCLVLTGEVNHEELLQTLDEFETSILDSIPSPDAPFKRPWIESKQTPPLASSTVEVVEFPDEDESYGQIDIRFLGPNITDRLEYGALLITLLYLAGSSASLLDNILVEKEQLASGIGYNVEERPRCEVDISISGVETDKLAEVERRFFELIRNAMEEDLDMDFMQDCITRYVRRWKFSAEGNASTLTNQAMTDYLFGNRDGSTLKDLMNLDVYTKDLPAWTQEQWKAFIKKYIADAHHVTILETPSAKLSEKLKKAEAERVEQQKKQLGPEGLQRKKDQLERAQAENDLVIPDDVLAKYDVPSTESIHFVKIDAARLGPALKIGRPNNRYQQIVETDHKDAPLFIDFEHIQSDFARINIILSIEAVPLELRPLLPLFMEALFYLPIKRGNDIIDFKQVIVEIQRDSVGYGIDLADSLGNIECLRISFQAEAEKYSVAINWLKELLWSTVFDVERLKAVNSRLLADIPDLKRSGQTMLTAVHLMTHLAPESIGRAKCTLVRALYLKKIRNLLKSDPEKVVQMLERLRETLCKFENMRVLVVGDLDKLQNPVTAWQPFLEGLDTTKELTPLSRRYDRLSDAGKKFGTHSYVVPIPTIDSSFAYALAAGPFSFDDPRLPGIMVTMAYMNAVEGPLWVAVRGNGFAYGTTMSYDIEAGNLTLEITRSPDAYKAFDASRKVVEGHMNGTIGFDSLMLEGAISQIVASFADAHATAPGAARTNFVWTVMRGLAADHMPQMLAKVRAITVPEIKQCLKDSIYPMFEPSKADVLVTCAPGLKETIKEGLVSRGFHAEIRDLASFQDDYGLKDGEPEGGVEDEDEDEDMGEDGDGGSDEEMED